MLVDDHCNMNIFRYFNYLIKLVWKETVALNLCALKRGGNLVKPYIFYVLIQHLIKTGSTVLTKRLQKCTDTRNAQL